MIVEERIDIPEKVVSTISNLCSAKVGFELKTESGLWFEGGLEKVEADGIVVNMKLITQNARIEEAIGERGEIEANYGANTYRFDTVILSANKLQIPILITIHPKRKFPRIKIEGNPLVENMYAMLFMKVVDPRIKDEELIKKINMVITSLQSHLLRAEKYDLAVVKLFDGTEKGEIIELIKEQRKPFVMFDIKNIKQKEEGVITYEDLIKRLNQKGYDYKKIMEIIEKVKESYQKNQVVAEAYIPLIFEDESIGYIRVLNKQERLSISQVKRLMQLAEKTVDDLLTNCSFEIATKKPQKVHDLSLGGICVSIDEELMTKYVRPMKRVYIQLFFPDETSIKTLGTIVNIYSPQWEPVKKVGIRFSATMDWRDKEKLRKFIETEIDLEKKGILHQAIIQRKQKGSTQIT